MITVIRKSLNTRKSTYIGLNLSKKSLPWNKGFGQNGQLAKCQKSSKNSQNQDFEPSFQANYNLYKQTFDVFHGNTIRSCYHENFMKKYWKLSEICSKNFEKLKISFLPLVKKGHVTLGTKIGCSHHFYAWAFFW